MLRDVGREPVPGGQSVAAAVALVPADQLEDRAGQLCASVSANPAAAVTAVNGLLVGADRRDRAEQSALERRAQGPLLAGLTAGE